VAGFDFGERALVTNEPRSATVMTITPTDLLVVDREVFSRYVNNKIIYLFQLKSNIFW
jgi:CRP-like cAMP-binding protein